MPTALLWLRNDLRLDDHAPLLDALDAAGPDGRLLAAYVLDPRHTAETRYGFRKAEGHRVRFLLESLRDLRARMRAAGGELVVRRGLPHEVLPELARAAGATTLHLHEEPMREEADAEAAVREALAAAVPELTVGARWGHTLVDPEALPFGPADLPDVFTQFRKPAERTAPYPAPWPAPAALPPPPDGVEPGAIPASAAELGVEPREIDPRAAFRPRGGEAEGRARLEAYVWTGDHLRTYKETRNGMLALDDSSKLSPWLSLGCLSPRRVQAEVRRYEDERVRNDSTYWLTFELLWRDFFRLYGRKHGDRLFWPSGPKGHAEGAPRRARLDADTFARWREGRTGVPFVDAMMIELAETGFLSNRGRQNAASFFAKVLGQDWRAGAAWFEAMLVDYDVTSNWGNWAYVGGVGSDPRDRYFDVRRQADRYDPEADFVRHWIPELAALPPGLALAPWKMSALEQEAYGVHVGETVPRPIVDLDAAYRRLRDRSGNARSGNARKGDRRRGGSHKGGAHKRSRRR